MGAVTTCYDPILIPILLRRWRDCCRLGTEQLQPFTNPDCRQTFIDRTTSTNCEPSFRLRYPYGSTSFSILSPPFRNLSSAQSVSLCHNIFPSQYLHRVYVTPGFRDPPMPPADLTLEQLEDIMADFHKQIACHAKIPTEPNPFDGLPRCGTTNDLINLSTDCPSDDLSSRSESSDLVSGRSSSESLPSERPHSAKAILLDNSRSSDREADFTDSADLQRVALLGPVDENPFEAEDDEQFSLISF